VVDAVRCAIEVQNGLIKRNGGRAKCWGFREAHDWRKYVHSADDGA